MIYTVTLNPAIDYVVHLPGTLKAGELNRSAEEEAQLGGKGINVSSVLKTLGEDTLALGIVAGFTGQGLEEGLRSQGLKVDFVHIREGFTRINVKVKAGAETEINGSGPRISVKELEELMDKLEAAKPGDTVVMAGSIPKGVPEDIYARLAKRLEEKQIRTVVDTTGKKLLEVLPYHPFLIKPNHQELSDLFGEAADTEEQIIALAKILWSQGDEPGARNVLVSRGSKGALLLDENGEIHRIGTVGGAPVNTVGAGDSMVAGFLHGCLMSQHSGHMSLQSADPIDYEEALKWGTAAGGATAGSLGLADRERILELMKELGTVRTW